MQINYPNSNGTTLIELLVALAAGSMLIGAVYIIYIAQVRGQIAQEAALELQQGIRSAFLKMKNEIRTAGVDPTGMAGAGILIAKPDEFHFTRDVVDESGTGRFDGVISGPNEDIRYALNTGDLARETRRPTGNGKMNSSGLQRFLDNVDVLNFVYLDSNGQKIDDVTLQTEAGRNAIRQVQLTIVARYNYSRRGLQTGHIDNHLYRNQFGDPLVVKPFADRNRRLKMTTTIGRRNMQ